MAIALLGTDVAKETMVEPNAQRRPGSDHDAVEWLITTRGTGDHDAVEWMIMMAWNG
ncbi:MAG: hypothetical protein ACR2NO_04715 [Chloroflexota bacterium]